MLERYYRDLLNFLSRKVADRSVAADLTQETYARIYAAQASGTAINNGRALLYQTARNLAIDHQRHNIVRDGVEVPLTDDEPIDAPGPMGLEPEAALASQQGILSLVAAIDGLPLRCREAFMLNRFEGMTYSQVAERMGISVKAVEQHIKHALDVCERIRLQDRGTPGAMVTARKKLNRSKHG
ncbi:RNA polymerase sigma factor [Comamonas composti]|uniref:RNA polymerase sigma factor n=1 Tax=Comamonas composti TaxID=408558 RepID=UPI00054EBDB2|nr:sigma-70 family RNA polymerase sigma factor [Comamonas composti]